MGSYRLFVILANFHFQNMPVRFHVSPEAFSAEAVTGSAEWWGGGNNGETACLPIPDSSPSIHDVFRLQYNPNSSSMTGGGDVRASPQTLVSYKVAVPLLS